MRSWPAPTGRPVSMYPRPDPWAAELRRREERRLRRARRWRIAFLVLVAVVVAAGAVTATWWVDNVDDEPPGRALPAPSTARSPSTTVTPTVRPTTIAPDALVAVDDIWLLDRDDGVFDWGVTVVVPDGGGVRSDVDVTVRVLDEGGAVVGAESRTIDAVSDSAPAAVAGRLVDPPSEPVRLEFDVSVGTPATALGVAALLDVRAVTREDDVVAGRIRSSSTVDIAGVSIVLVWRAPDSEEIVAATIYDIERVRPGVDARFEIDVADERVPDGEPDGVFLAP